MSYFDNISYYALKEAAIWHNVELRTKLSESPLVTRNELAAVALNDKAYQIWSDLFTSNNNEFFHMDTKEYLQHLSDIDDVLAEKKEALSDIPAAITD